MLNQRHRRSPKNLTINDVYPDWIDGKGVMASMEAAPWMLVTSLQALDYAYHGVRSGSKFASQILYNFLTEDGEITDAGRGSIATMLMSMYGVKWLHLWNLYNIEYNPLHTYVLTENEQVSTSGRDKTGTKITDIFSRGQTMQERANQSLSGQHDWSENEINGEAKETETDTENVRSPSLTESETDVSYSKLDSEKNQRPNVSETTIEQSNTTVDGTVVKTPNTQEHTVLSENVQSTGSENTDTTYGHVVGSVEDISAELATDLYGFNSSESVPSDKNQSSGQNSKNSVNSGTDRVERVNSEISGKSNTSDTSMTGSETTDDDTSTVTSSGKTTLKSGIDVATENTETNNNGSKIKLTGGKEESKISEKISASGEATRVGAGSDYNAEQVDNSRVSTQNDLQQKNGEQSVEFDTARAAATTRTKSGNMFKAPAELLSLDRDFWMQDFFEIVFADIDKLLTLAVFSESPVHRKYF